MIVSIAWRELCHGRKKIHCMQKAPSATTVRLADVPARWFSPDNIDLKHNIDLVVASLPRTARGEQSLPLLPHVLCDWDQNELQQHFTVPSPTQRREIRDRARALRKPAAKLAKALADKKVRNFIVSRFLVTAGQEIPFDFESVDATQQALTAAKTFLERLASIEMGGRRGQPPNLIAYLVLRDLAELFEWTTGLVPTRQTDRIKGRETGPFYRFARVAWPIVFGNEASGLPAAMKNWERYRNQGERSALMVKIDRRHPEWRIFEE